MLLKNAFIYNQGVFEKADLRIIDSTNYEIGKELAPNKDEQVIYLESKYILPGLVDVHVHFREPGFEYKETIKTGSLAAARGGFTSVCAMPNLNPFPDSTEVVNRILEIIKKDALINVYQYGCITKEQKGEELVDFEGLRDKVIGFSDDGRPVLDSLAMAKAMKEASRNNSILAAHCEDLSYYDPRKAEYMHIRRDIELLKKNPCKYHVCHVSSKESVDSIRQAKKESLDITCETAPHYLILTEKDRQSENFVMNPPLAKEADRLALIEGILDGTIDMIATDHAPHSKEDKVGGAMGIIGLETSFSLMYTHFVKTKIISLERLVELMSINPKKRFDMPLYSDFSVWDLDEKFKVDPEKFLSKGRNTPFSQMDLFAKTLLTICKGKIVWKSLS